MRTEDVGAQELPAFEARCEQRRPDGSPGLTGTVTAALADDRLVVTAAGTTLSLPYSDVDGVTSADFQVRLALFDGAEAVISHLGQRLDEFTRLLTTSRARQMARDLALADEGLPVGEYSCRASLAPSGEQPPEQDGTLFLYQTSLAFLPHTGNPFGAALSEVRSVEFDQATYSLRLACEQGDINITRAGKRFGELKAQIEALLTKLAQRTEATLTALVPGLPYAALSCLSQLLKDGHAARETEIEGLAPGLFGRLAEVAQIKGERKESFESLRKRCPPGWAYLGMKLRPAEQQKGPEERELSEEHALFALGALEGKSEGEATGEAEETAQGQPPTEEAQEKPPCLFWFFTPIFDPDKAKPGNVVAHEVTSEEDHATYFFRLMPDDQYRALTEKSALEKEVASSVTALNRALRSLNFRREPIYAREEEMTSGRLGRYRCALRKLPHLGLLRASFLGRALHTSRPAWEKQVKGILKQLY